MATTSVLVDDHELIGLDSSGGLWKVLSLTGWHDLPAVRRDRQDRAQQDGTWPSTGFTSGRAITITGSARFTDPASAKLAARQLRSIVGAGQATMTVVDAAGELSATVERDGVSVAVVNDRLFSWTVSLFAPDPLLYGAQIFGSTDLSAQVGTGRVWPRVWPTDWGTPAGQTPGSVVVANNGSAAYWPRLRIDGPVPNPRVTLVETGDWIRYEGTVAAGQWLDIDLANRRILINGQVSVRQSITSSGAWLAVPEGGGSISWTADGADPAAKLSVWSYEGAWS